MSTGDGKAALLQLAYSRVGGGGRSTGVCVGYSCRSLKRTPLFVSRMRTQPPPLCAQVANGTACAGQRAPNQIGGRGFGVAKETRQPHPPDQMVGCVEGGRGLVKVGARDDYQNQNQNRFLLPCKFTQTHYLLWQEGAYYHLFSLLNSNCCLSGSVRLSQTHR